MIKPKRWTVEERFWNKVNKLPGDDACWEWTANTYRDGYGQLKVDGRPVSAHRLAYTWATGRLPINAHVLHTCDNPRCVNYNHLVLGTNLANMQDKVAKGRQAYGEAHGRAHLTERSVREIRRRFAAGGVTQRQLAVEFGTPRTTVWNIIHRKTWKHLT